MVLLKNYIGARRTGYSNVTYRQYGIQSVIIYLCIKVEIRASIGALYII